MMKITGTTFDQEIYSPDFQLDGPHLIEASAGTGKTYNIQNIYVRLIMEKNLRVSQILVMTFTEAATKELHDRLHTIIQDVQCRFAGLDCPEKDEKKKKSRNDRADKLIRCIQPTCRNQARMNVEMALLEFDQSAIFTIHGFCKHVLSRYSFDAGINFVQEIDKNKTAELNALTEDWWRCRPSGLHAKISLNELMNFVQKLAGKTDYEVKQETPEAWKLDMLKAAMEIVKKYEAARPDSQTMTFDDLLYFLRKALKDNDVRSHQLITHLRDEFKAALIDEFQDTDPVQYDIFERIFLNGNPNPLFFVGDPKQAIYGFRGGDIYTYLKAKSNSLLRLSSLKTNFRSTKRIMEAVNDMFADPRDGRTFEHELIDYPFPGALVEKDPDIKGSALDKPFQIIEFTQKGKKPGVTADMPQILELMSAQILQILKNPVFSPGDIAILTNSNQRSLDIYQRLMAAHIPSVVRKSGNVFSSPVAKELWLFLLAAAHPMEKKILPCALTTVFCSDPLSDLSQLDDPGIQAKYIALFSSLNHEWKTHGLAALIAILEDGGYRKRIAVRPDGTRQLADVGQILELCFAAVKQIGPSSEKLVSWLGEKIDEGLQENTDVESEENARELETDEDAIKIMTIYVSKGLQFPIVFLPDCWNLTNPSDSRNKLTLPVYHDDEDNEKLVFSLSDDAKLRCKNEMYQEKIRFLYVAMTRAVQQMVLFTPGRDFLQNEPLCQLLTNLEARGGDTPPYQIIRPEPGSHCSGEYTPQSENVSWKKALLPPLFNLLPSKGSFSSLFHTGKKTQEEEDDSRDIDSTAGQARRESKEEDNADHPVFQIPSGAAIGTCWHNILEKMSFDADEAKIREIAEEELTNSGFMQEDGILETTCDMLQRTMQYGLCSPAGERFTLSEVPWEKRRSEQEFEFSAFLAGKNTETLKDILRKYWADDPSKKEFLQMLSGEAHPIPKGFMTGFIDLLFQHGEFFYIIDWKSNSIDGKRGNFTEPGVRREMAKNLYFFQYLLYAVVLHFYLKQTLGSRYSWERNFGGIRYFFLRGIAAEGEAPVFEDRPSAALLDELGHAFGIETTERK